jgi:hypothetical protein
MGLIAYFGDNFFEPLAAVGAPEIGQIGWAPVPFLQPQPNVIEVERIESGSHDPVRAKFVPLRDLHFTKKSPKGLPILNIHLGETEELLAYKAKKRPVVVVGTRSTVLGSLGQEAKPHHEESRTVVAPIYGLATEDDPRGFGSILSTRVRHLLYLQFFPFAEWRETRHDLKGASWFNEGIIRFDRLQFLLPSAPGLQLAPVRMAPEVRGLIHNVLWAYLHAEPSPELIEMREVLRSVLPDLAKPSI